MALSGLKSGLNGTGLLQGVKGGSSLGQMKIGLVGGNINTMSNRSNMQNPLNLTGNKKPLMYGLPDFYTITGSTITNLTDIANTGRFWTSNGSAASRPIPRENKLNGRTMLVYEGASAWMSSNSAPSSTAKNAYTIIFVAKMNGTGNMTMLTSNSITAGAINVQAGPSDTYSVRSDFYYSTSNFSTWSSVSPSNRITRDYAIYTVKYRLAQPGGVGSEQLMYINGQLQHYPVSTTFTLGTTTAAMNTIAIGNSPTSPNTLARDFELGACMVFDYFVNESEQLRLENYLRYYYNERF
jgi:hypothetical protein